MTVNCPSCNEQIEIPRAAVPPAPKISDSAKPTTPPGEMNEP